MNKLTSWFRKYFIPHEANSHAPHALRHEGLILFFALVIVVELGFLAQVFLVFDKTNFLAAVLPGVLTNLTNNERQDEGLPTLKENALLNEAARLKAQDMAEKGYFAHTSPTGLTPWHWLEVVGYNFTAAGENLAVNFSESLDVTEAWMNSPTHRANIIRKDFTEIGIGVAQGIYKGKKTTFVAQFFGTPGEVKVAPAQAAPKSPPKPVPQVTATEVAVTTITPSREAQVLGEEAASGGQIRSFIQRALTSPNKSANMLYGGMGVAVLLVLVLFFIRSEIHHPKMVARGVLMLSIIALLFYLNLEVVKVKTEVPIETITSNVIFAY